MRRITLERHRADAISLVVGLVVFGVALSVLTDSVDDLADGRSWIVAAGVAIVGLVLLLTARGPGDDNSEPGPLDPGGGPDLAS